MQTVDQIVNGTTGGFVVPEGQIVGLGQHQLTSRLDDIHSLSCVEGFEDDIILVANLIDR